MISDCTSFTTSQCALSLAHFKDATPNGIMIDGNFLCRLCSKLPSQHKGIGNTTIIHL